MVVCRLLLTCIGSVVVMVECIVSRQSRDAHGRVNFCGNIKQGHDALRAT